MDLKRSLEVSLSIEELVLIIINVEEKSRKRNLTSVDREKPRSPNCGYQLYSKPNDLNVSPVTVVLDRKEPKKNSNGQVYPTPLSLSYPHEIFTRYKLQNLT